MKEQVAGLRSQLSGNLRVTGCALQTLVRLNKQTFSSAEPAHRRDYNVQTLRFAEINSLGGHPAPRASLQLKMLNAYCLASAVGGEVLDLVNQTGLVAKTVLLILLAFSVLSWAIILSKWGLFRRARAQSNRFMRMFRKSERLQDVAAVADQFKPSPLVGVFDNGLRRVQAPVRSQPRRCNVRSRSPLGRTDSLGKPLAMAGHDRRGDAVHRPVRNGLGHH